jgi:lipopolysaccharide transport system ATP-binding protein
MGTAIKVEHLSKIYRLGEIGTGTLSQDFNRWMARVRGKEDPYLIVGELNDRMVKGGDIVYSLRDIDFEIEEGDAVGIIGRNGAGKSTLLKILSRITSPTAGRIHIRGRIASLLEVGTGFHPELTGKENIYLNGAIMGMRKKEIDRKLEEIIDFSGVERYIDTPVKRFSSGMYVRLAFAVAAHLESEILIVDEVLAVGDQEFQKKCLGKMGEVSKGEGKTVLFVSHNMAAIKSLCSSGIFLQNGVLSKKGEITEIIKAYLDNSTKAGDEGLIPEGASTFYTGVARYKRIRIVNHSGDKVSLYYRTPIKIYAEIECSEDINDAILDIRIANREGFQVVHCSNIYNNGSEVAHLHKGITKVEIEIENLLQPGSYSLTPGIHQRDGLSLDYVENILDFDVMKIAVGKEQDLVYNWDMGIIRLNSDWKVYAQ